MYRNICSSPNFVLIIYDLINPFSESPQPSFHHSATPQKYLKTLSCNLSIKSFLTELLMVSREVDSGNLITTASNEDVTPRFSFRR